jgi:hypothetical protein
MTRYTVSFLGNFCLIKINLYFKLSIFFRNCIVFLFFREPPVAAAQLLPLHRSLPCSSPARGKLKFPPLSLVHLRQRPPFIGCPEKKPANYYPYIARFLAPHQREVKFPPLSLVHFRRCPPFIGCPEKNRQNIHLKSGFLYKFFCLFFKLKVHKSQNCRNHGFSYYICLMIDRSGSVPLTNGSGSATLRVPGTDLVSKYRSL